MPGIKETQDVLALAKHLGVAVSQARADGSINFLDAPIVMQLITPLRTAIEGSQNVPVELLDLDKAEAQALAGQSIDAVWTLVRAILGLPQMPNLPPPQAAA